MHVNKFKHIFRGYTTFRGLSLVTTCKNTLLERDLCAQLAQYPISLFLFLSSFFFIFFGLRLPPSQLKFLQTDECVFTYESQLGAWCNAYDMVQVKSSRTLLQPPARH